jgi:hypothetical protein
MTKVERARIILGQILSLESRMHDVGAGDSNAPARLRTVKIENRWLATIRRSDACRAGTPVELPVAQWDQLHLEVAGALKLGLRFLGDKIDIILFDPGVWELWFNTYDPADTDLVRP